MSQERLKRGRYTVWWKCEGHLGGSLNIRSGVSSREESEGDHCGKRIAFVCRDCRRVKKDPRGLQGRVLRATGNPRKPSARREVRSASLCNYTSNINI